MRSQNRLLPLTSFIVLFASLCHGAAITGTVKGADGAPFEGAFVTAQNTSTRMSFSVLSDTQGHYRIEKLPAGEYRLQSKSVGYRSEARTGVKLKEKQKAAFDFALQQGDIRWSDISYYQAKQLWPSGKGKELIANNCATCHMFQTRMASTVRDEEGWRDRIEYMRKTMDVAGINDQEAGEIAAYLNSLFGPDSVLPKSPSEMPKYKETVRPFSKDALNIVYVEYDMPGPSRMPFSAAPDDKGYIWIPNFGPSNKISRLDPKTGEMVDYTAPNVGAADIHSAVPAPDGSVWITEQISNKVGRWDPKTQKITEYLDGSETVGSKHTVRIDPSGNVWASGSPLTKFDPKTLKFTRFEEVQNTYDVKPDKNGDVWFTVPRNNKIGKVDGKTMKVTQWTAPTPNSFPRRMEIGPDGKIWFGQFRAGKMASFDPVTETFKEYPLPGPEPTPYSLGFDADGYLWYNSHHMDVVGRFDTKTGNVIEYPFPHSETAMREFFRDSEGRMWYGTNPNNKVGYFYLANKNGKVETARK